MPSLNDFEYARELSRAEDSRNAYATVAAPGANAAIATVSTLSRGTYEVEVDLRITAGANATVTPDNYEIRVGATSKRRIVHGLVLANGTIIVNQKARVRVPAGSNISVNAVAAEVAASSIAANVNVRRIGDYFA